MWDFLISLFFVFAMFAGLVSGANEILAQLFGWRSNVLREAIAGMLGEREKWIRWVPLAWFGGLFGIAGRGKTKAAELFDHPLVTSLALPGERPSYIQAETFAAALVRTLAPDGSLAGVTRAVRNGSTELGRLLGPMLDEAHGDLADFERRVSAHYDRVMDRAQGWYKRRTQVVMLMVAALLAVGLNVDAIHIAQRLSTDATLRTAIASAAEEATREHDAAKARAREAGGAPSTPPDAKAEYDALVKKLDELQQSAKKMQALGLPIGWERAPGSARGRIPAGKGFHFEFHENQKPSSAIFGWILTAIAGSLGAPFWFDAISRVINLRGAGKKPDRVADGTGSATPAASQPTATASGAPAATTIARTGLTDYEATRLNEVDIEALQRALGSPPSEVDGLLDDRLRARLRAWQELNGQPPSGRFDEPTVLAILYP